MENLWEKKSVGYGEEMERKWNGNGMGYFMTSQVETNFDGMEWKWNGIEIETFQWQSLYDCVSKTGME